ncbi:MAG: bifunctional 4-hydroxy-2-oxoglutarate aldolase/2-dehydro-3-deoxy-phosphogluconate aldolase [Anaerolineales bacterium]|nr:bifunctional 4-hydroxy-2-oxoglutarate aldolase/2-dehydro-3-deoxy-phosphogluconate aldolase [Anaerolineales bacterium]
MGKREDVLQQIRVLGLLAVLRGPTPEMTIEMVNALVEGGVLGIEITYSTPQADVVVKRLREIHGNRILLGMGTVTTVEQVERAAKAGVQFLVSPHGERKLAKAMRESKRPFMMGALTPSEVLQVVQWGADIVKIFPGSLGGPAYLKALRGPFPDIPMMPTGGVAVDNVAEWFAAGAVAVGAGGALCPTALAVEGRFEEITKCARNFVSVVNAARKQ